MRKRIVKQHIVVLAVTVLLTVLSACIFSEIYLHLDRMAAREENIFLADGVPIATELPIGTVEVREIEMYAKLSETYTFRGVTYIPEAKTYQSDGAVYTHLRLVPIARENGYFRGLILTTLTAFCTVYGVGLFFVWHRCGRDITRPLERLSKDLDRLVEGALTTAVTAGGEAEIRALADKAEKLRLRLAETAEKAKKADADRKFLISSISHDLKTPVAALSGYLEGIRDGVAASPEKRRAYLAKAIEKTTLLADMIGELLLFAKLDMQEIALSPALTEITPYMEALLEEMGVAFPKMHIALESHLPAGTRLWIDRALFARVVRNISENAHKYADKEEKHLWVSLHKTEAAVIFEFRDNGCGIAEKDIAKVFDRFYRADTARAAEGSGGLGLAIARQITEAQGGRIWAASVKGEGTSIRISLPLVRNTEQ